MIKIVAVYVLIALLLYIRNKYLYLKCSYLCSCLQLNKDNYNYIIPVNSIMHKAHLYNPIFSDPQNFANEIFIKDICECLLQARGIFYTFYMRSPLWLFYLIQRLVIFTPITKIVSNKFIASLCSIVESFALYLLGLYLDTTGIGNKTLSLIRGVIYHLINTLKEFL